MTAREEFEAWAEPQGILLGRVISDERYESMTTEWAYRAWKASRAAALEEAAKESAQVANIFLERNADAFAAAAVCCERVRALKD